MNRLDYHSLARDHADKGDHIRALELCQMAIEQQPDNLDAWLLLGTEYAESGDHQEAIRCLHYCIAHSPPVSVLHQILGIILAEAGQHKDALDQFRTACRITPEDDQVQTRLAMELIHFLQMSAAKVHLLKALSVNNSNALAYNSLGRVYKFQGRIPEAVSAFRKSLELEPDNQVAANNLLLCLNYCEDIAPEEIANEHKLVCQHIFGYTKKSETTEYPPACKPIRIGYVSGDFHTHSVAYFLESILQNHNPQRVQVFCYSNDTQLDETTRRLMACNVTWKDIARLSDHDAAEVIRKDGIHILVDLSGHTSGNRLGLFALKPAAVQASWIGYPGTTGLQQIDYFISDAYCAPLGLTEHLFTEKLIRLPRTFSCYLPPFQFPAVSPPPSSKTGIITFGSFNHFAKANSRVIAVWANVLKQVQDSRLFLKSMALGDPSSQRQVLNIFAQHGITPERIALLHPVSSSLEHLELYSQIDIALDTFPYNGTTTTCEALWMGVPVVTLAGRNHAGRVGVSLLSSIALRELVADSPEKYIEIASELAKNSSRLLQLRNQLREMMATSPLMDGAGVTSELENAYETMMHTA